jgi:hypothetical protein
MRLEPGDARTDARLASQGEPLTMLGPGIPRSKTVEGAVQRSWVKGAVRRPGHKPIVPMQAGG